LNKLIYKTFTWPHNPDYYQHSYSRDPVYEPNEAGQNLLVGVGPGRLIITGSGSFCGDTAYADFQKLIALFREGTAGNLLTPQWGTIFAFLTELELTQEPRPDYVAYRFTFREMQARPSAEE